MDHGIFCIDGDASNIEKRPGDSVITLECGLNLTFDSSIAQEIALDDWRFIFYGEYRACPDLHRVRDLIRSESYDQLWGTRGILIVIAPEDDRILVFNDCYGSNAIYFHNNPGAGYPVAADSLRRFPSEDIDWVSFYEFLSYGYTVGEHSLIENVSRLMANSMLEIGVKKSSVYAKVVSLHNFWLIDARPVNNKIDNIIDVLRVESGKLAKPQIMMSGGWDSRLLLAALRGVSPQLYTHGDLESRETAIVRDISQTYNFTLFEKSFTNIEFSNDLFSRYLINNESMMFTHWDAAGKVAEDSGCVLTAGTLGEFLGGHYGMLNMMGSREKYFSLLMHTLGIGEVFDRFLNQSQGLTYLKRILSSRGYGAFWMLKDDVGSQLKDLDIVNISNQRLSKVISGYADQGIDDVRTLFERFYTEHRGGRYINLQLTNAINQNCYRNIYTNRDLVEIGSTIPFGFRAHNKINKSVIERVAPELLDFPMAATLANASRPLVVQEFSRALRKQVEKQGFSHALYRKLSRYGDKRFGWNNFRNVVNDSLIDQLDGILNWDFWDQGKIRLKVSENSRGSNGYSMFDMLSKAATIDWQVKGELR
jgi:hypothetical protein